MKDETQPKRGGRPRKTETPANNAESVDAAGDNAGVAGPTTEFFEKLAKSIDEPEQLDGVWLPELPGPEQNRIGTLAEVLHASGYFGDLTPAQLAVYMLAGESLGLSPIQSVFDLEITIVDESGRREPRLSYKPGLPFMNAADSVELVKASREDPATPGKASKVQGTVSQFPNNANKGPSLEPKAADVAEPAPDPETASEAGPDAGAAAITEQPPQQPKYEGPAKSLGDTITHKQTNLLTAAAAERGIDPDTLAASVYGCTLAELNRAGAARLIFGLEDPNSEIMLKFADRATPETATAADNAESDVQYTDAGKGVTANNETPDERETTAEIYAESRKGVKDPAPAPTIDAGAFGDDVPRLVDYYRDEITRVLTEHAFDANVISEKMSTFEAANIVGKRQQYEKTIKWNTDKIEAIRQRVLVALATDGKKTLDAQKGFYIFAEVPTDPAEWFYSDAVKAELALSGFVDPPPPAAQV